MPEISAAAMQPKMYEDSHYPTHLCSSARIRGERCKGYSDQNRFDQNILKNPAENTMLAPERVDLLVDLLILTIL